MNFGGGETNFIWRDMVEGEWNFTSEMEIKCDTSSIRFNSDCPSLGINADRRVR